MTTSGPLPAEMHWSLTPLESTTVRSTFNLELTKLEDITLP
jgi:hypothetical protein